MGEEIRDKTGFTGLIACHWGKVRFENGISVGITLEQREGLLAFGHNYVPLDEAKEIEETGKEIEAELIPDDDERPKPEWPDETWTVLSIDRFAGEKGFELVTRAKGKRAKLAALEKYWKETEVTKI